MKADFAAILAAGKGERMNSASPAALLRVCGRSLARWALEAVSPCASSLPVLVHGPGGEVEVELGARARYAVQNEPRGTADALWRALETAPIVPKLALVVYANAPLVKSEHYGALIEAAAREGAAALVYQNEETGGLEQGGAWCFTGSALEKALAGGVDRASVGDLAGRLASFGIRVREVLADSASCLAAADRKSLAACEAAMRARIVGAHMENGVTFTDPSSVTIGPEVRIGRDAEIARGVVLAGDTRIGAGSRIKSGCSLENTTVGRNCELSYVVANGAAIGDDVKVGPFVNLRPGTVIGDAVKIGDFVEVKNAVIGRGSKLPHLSYIGDADVGERVNVGCGTVFVNYDGFRKYRTFVGNDVFLGCQTNLVAPVRVEDDAYTAAGSTITRDVPAGAMAIARARQENKPGYVERLRSLKGREE